MADPKPVTNDPFNGKSLQEWAADMDAKDREQWQESGSSLTFEAWQDERRAQRRAEEEAKRVAEARAQAHAARVAALAKQIPSRYSNAETDNPQLLGWVEELIGWSKQVQETNDTRQRRHARVVDWHDEPTREPLELDVVAPNPGPSVLLLGPTGVGKTHHAFGALRRFAADGGLGQIVVAPAADLYATLRPRNGVDSEDMFARYAKAMVLFIDDLGAAKTSPWVEEINYRLINYRYNNQLATLFTSNVPTKELGEYLGERVASRIVGMAKTVVLKGDDRRRRAA